MEKHEYNAVLMRKISDPDMVLPDGKTCGDCGNHAYCVKLFGCKSHNVTCDWAPSRFQPCMGKSNV